MFLKTMATVSMVLVQNAWLSTLTCVFLFYFLQSLSLGIKGQRNPTSITMTDETVTGIELVLGEDQFRKVLYTCFVLRTRASEFTEWECANDLTDKRKQGQTPGE